MLSDYISNFSDDNNNSNNKKKNRASGVIEYLRVAIIK